jgi:flagellar hook-basal body complex protein FliE
MTVAPIGSLGSLANLGPLLDVGAPATRAPQKPAGAGFGEMFADALDGLQAQQRNASDLAVKASTGDIQDIHDYTIAATQASLATELTVAIRNKAVEAFNEIMRMPI